MTIRSGAGIVFSDDFYRPPGRAFLATATFPEQVLPVGWWSASAVNAIDPRRSRLDVTLPVERPSQEADALHLAKAIIERKTTGHRPWPRAKRALDLGIIALAAPPVMLLSMFIALAIFIEDRGPIFYRQARVGLNGVPKAFLRFFRPLHSRTGCSARRCRWFFCVPFRSSGSIC
ncbi:MAG: hypothetical protein C0524_04350 [Rhodobacter sp.]|nr:hypothetical protein [Rhodobacter sp.]